MNIKYITVTIENDDGLKISSVFCMPEHRTTRTSTSLKNTFKPMLKCPIKWFKNLITSYK